MITRALCLMILTICIVFSFNLSACRFRSHKASNGNSGDGSTNHNGSAAANKDQTLVLQTTIDKAREITKILEVVQKLSLMAGSSTEHTDADPDERIRQKIYNEVEAIKKPDQLVILGRICRSILADQEAGDAAYDNVFNTAFWHCVSLLSQDTSDDAVRALNELWIYSNTDAGDSVLFKEAIADQKLKREHK